MGCEALLLGGAGPLQQLPLKRPWVRYGFCPHGRPHWVTTHYGGQVIVYCFVICQVHRISVLEEVQARRVERSLAERSFAHWSRAHPTEAK